MKIVCFLFLMVSSWSNYAQTFWTGSLTTFTKEAHADWTIEENQDRITENIWITRQNQWSIFNIAQFDISSPIVCSSGHPNDTQWAWGNISDGVQNLTFDLFLGSDFVDCEFGTNGVNLIGKEAVLHLISDDIYMDIKFLSWTTNGGGGFSYERSTDQNLSSRRFEHNNDIKLLPNPSSELIQVFGLRERERYIIYNILGAEIKSGTIANKEKFFINDLKNGLYFLTLAHQSTVKFIKE